MTESRCHLPLPDLVSIGIGGRPLSPDKLLEEDSALSWQDRFPIDEAKHIVATLRTELQTAGREVQEDFSADD